MAAQFQAYTVFCIGYVDGVISPEARALHERYPAIDLHADTLMWARWVGYDMRRRHNAPLPRAALGGHVDVPRLREGGIGAQFFGLVSVPIGQKRGLARVIDEQIDELDTVVGTDPSLVKVQSALDIDRVTGAGKIAALLGIEGAHSLEGDLAKLEHFARRGVRYLGFCHFSANDACAPAYGWGRDDEQGLTSFGKDLVHRCEDLGVIVNLAHINRKGFFDACALSKKPLWVSHTGVLGAYAHWRNIDDTQLRAVAKTGGCVGVIFCPRYLGGDGLEAVVQHLKHILDTVGEDGAALGSDWDGLIVPTRDLCDAAQLPRLTDALLQARISERVIGKILRDNAMRVLGDNPPKLVLRDTL